MVAYRSDPRRPSTLQALRRARSAKSGRRNMKPARPLGAWAKTMAAAPKNTGCHSVTVAEVVPDAVLEEGSYVRVDCALLIVDGHRGALRELG